MILDIKTDRNKRIKYFLLSFFFAALLYSCKTDNTTTFSENITWAQADALYDGRNYQEALGAYRILRDTAKTISNWEQYYNARAQMAFCLWRILRSAEAYALADSISSEVSLILGAEHEFNAKVLTIMGNIHCDKRTQQDYEQSLIFFKQALAIYEKHHSPPSAILAKAWERLGIARFLMYDYIAAVPFYKKSLSMLDKLSVDNMDAYYKIESNLGLQYGGMGHHEKAIGQYQKSRAIFKQLNKAPDARLADSFFNQSVSERGLGDWAAALISLEQAWDIEQDYGEKASILRPFILEGWGDCYRDQKMWDKALRYYKLFLDHWEEDEVDHRNGIIGAWLNVGQCYLAKGEHEKAIVLFKKADQLTQKAYGLRHLNRVNPLLELQQIARQTHDYKQANHYLSTALTIAQQQLGNYHPLVAKVYYQKALLGKEQAHLTEAMQFCQQTQEVLKLTPNRAVNMANSSNPQLYLEAELLKAQLYLAQGDQLRAIHHYQLSLLFTDTLWHRIETNASKRFIQKRLPELAEQALDVLFQLWQKTKDLKYFEQAIWFADQSRSKRLQYERTLRKLNKRLPDSIFQQGRVLQENIQFYEQLLREAESPFDSFPANNWREQLLENQQNYSQWSLKWSKIWMQNESTKTVKINIKQLAQWSTKTQTDLLLFSCGKTQIHRLVWINNEAFWDVRKVGSTEISIVKQWKNTLNHPPQLWQSDEQQLEKWQQFIKNAYQLHQWLIPPAIKQSADTLVIMPDGLLHAFPFAALLTKKAADIRPLDYRHLPYFFQNHIIRYAYTLSDALQQEQLRNNPKYIAYAPASWPTTNWSKFNLADSLRLSLFSETLEQIPSLPNTIKEVEIGQDLFGGRVYKKEEAIEINFLQNVADADILHIATHAWLHPYDPNYTALLLQPSQKSDGWLFSREIESGQLSANVVILSSCYTGKGIDIPGEGISSLGRSFLAIGCSKVLMSNWALDDEINVSVVARFLKIMYTGISMDKALNNSKKQFLKEMKNDAYTHPYYWAGLSLCGKGG